MYTYPDPDPRLSGWVDDIKAAWDRLRHLQPGKILEREVLPPSPGTAPGGQPPESTGLSTSMILIGVVLLLALTGSRRR